MIEDKKEEGAKMPIIFPHCDPKVIHSPGVCKFCDESGLQEVRRRWQISFTGAPEEDKLPCPADHFRGENHKRWYGNRAYPPDKQPRLFDPKDLGC